jgi:hypothetical protein
MKVKEVGRGPGSGFFGPFALWPGASPLSQACLWGLGEVSPEAPGSEGVGIHIRRRGWVWNFSDDLSAPSFTKPCGMRAPPSLESPFRPLKPALGGRRLRPLRSEPVRSLWGSGHQPPQHRAPSCPRGETIQEGVAGLLPASGVPRSGGKQSGGPDGLHRAPGPRARGPPADSGRPAPCWPPGHVTPGVPCPSWSPSKASGPLKEAAT